MAIEVVSKEEERRVWGEDMQKFLDMEPEFERKCYDYTVRVLVKPFCEMEVVKASFCPKLKVNQLPVLIGLNEMQRRYRRVLSIESDTWCGKILLKILGKQLDAAEKEIDWLLKILTEAMGVGVVGEVGQVTRVKAKIQALLLLNAGACQEIHNK